MKRNINTRTSALATLAMVALSSTLLAQAPINPRLRPSEPKPASEEPAKPKEEGGIRGGEKPAAPAPAPAPAPAVAPGARPAPPEGKPVRAPILPPSGGTPIIKGDKKDPGEPGIIKGEPVKAGDKKAPSEPGVKGGEPNGEMKKPVGVRSGEVPSIVKPADPEKSAAESAKEPLAADFEASVRRKYDSLDHIDVPFEKFLGFERLEADRLRKLKENPASRYQPNLAKMGGGIPCQNGDFEPNGLQVGAWGFGFGKVTLNTGVVDYPNFTATQSSGLSLTDPNARHTATISGVDPKVGIPTTGPDVATGQPSGHAIRIGNAVTGGGAELISKTFTVTAAESTVRFWYAAVFQDPGHPAHQQPAFTVRTLVGGTEVQGLVDLGNGSGKIVADSGNPFFKTKPGGLVYKDWSCAQINLSAHIGKTVTVQFVTQDCSQTGHWGYAYIDNVCGKCTNSPTGDIQFNPAKSSKCGTGNICFDYSLPKDGNSTGTGVIALNLYQAGNLNPVATLTSPSLTSGTSYCFAVNPSTIAGLNASLGGFDFSATGTFTLGTSVTKLTVNGGVAGKDNDYQISCPKPIVADPCCADAGKNLFQNGPMDIGGGNVGSRYEFVTVAPRNPLLPGRVTLVEFKGIPDLCSVWQIPPACKKTKDFSGGVLAVNGLTNQPAGQKTAIVTDKLSLPKPEVGNESEYRVCFRYLPLPSCCFDVTPKLTVVVKKADGTPIALSNISDAPTGCGNLYSASFKAPQGVVIFEILLAEDAKGDGNDLLIDNISIIRLVPLADALVAFAENTTLTGNYTTGTFTVPPALSSYPGAQWQWTVLDANNNVLFTVPGNPQSTQFEGFNNGNQASAPGQFTNSMDYRVRLTVWTACNSKKHCTEPVSANIGARKMRNISIESIQAPEPVNQSK